MDGVNKADRDAQLGLNMEDRDARIGFNIAQKVMRRFNRADRDTRTGSIKQTEIRGRV